MSHASLPAMTWLRGATFLVCAVPAPLLAQDWPLPAKTQNTEVPCPTLHYSWSSSTYYCPGIREPGKVTVGYPAPIKTFTGRFLDSQITSTAQQTFRTARATSVVVAPERNRIYMLIGSALAAYSLDTFFSRLESGEAMVPS